MCCVDLKDKNGQMIIINGTVLAIHYSYFCDSHIDVYQFNIDAYTEFVKPHNWKAIATYFDIDLELYPNFHKFYYTYGNTSTCYFIDSEDLS